MKKKMNKLRRKEDWPFPLVEPGEEVHVNPVGNTAKNYIADFYGSSDPSTIPVDTFIAFKDVSEPFYLTDSKQNGTPVAFPSLEADPTGGSLNEPGKKADANKVLPWLFFSGFANALEETAKVTTLGAKKYTPGGWATVPGGVERYMEAAMRHMVALGKGKVLDDGIGGLGVTYHKAQVAWNILASLELELRALEIAKINQEKKT